VGWVLANTVIYNKQEAYKDKGHLRARGIHVQ
jgi:hypothetical protein